MAPLDTSSDILSLIASPTQTSGEVSPPENTTQPAPKTVFGVVFALVCFAIITSAFLVRRRYESLGCPTWPLLERLKGKVSCRRNRQQDSDTAREPQANIEGNPPRVSRQSTFPLQVSRASTFNQNLPEYSKNDPTPSPQFSTIGEVTEDSSLRAVTPVNGADSDIPRGH